MLKLVEFAETVSIIFTLFRIRIVVGGQVARMGVAILNGRFVDRWLGGDEKQALPDRQWWKFVDADYYFYSEQSIKLL